MAVTHLDTSGQTSHRFPYFLPDGHQFLFFATGRPDAEGVYLGSLDSEAARRLLPANTAAVFLPPDHVLFGRDEALYAQRLDMQSGLRAVGNPLLVAERVARDGSIFAGVALAAAASGTFAYRIPRDNSRELVWVDRAGKQVGSLGRLDGLAASSFPIVSPDGRTVLLTRIVDGNTDVWSIETARGVLTRLTFDPAGDVGRAWSPDGRRVLFQSARRKGGGVADIYAKSLSDGAEELLFESGENKNAWGWSPDGRFILFSSQNPATASDIWALPLDGDRKPFPVVQTPFDESGSFFSPDGRWISYRSNETGRYEVYIQPFPGPGQRWQISTNGGFPSGWRGDGREIYYTTSDNRIVAVPVVRDPKRSTNDVGAPVPLFMVTPGTAALATRDGQRFLLNTGVGESSTAPITVVLNWSGRNR